MITLTSEQRRELDQSDHIEVLDPQTQKTYVLVPADVYDQLKHLLFDDTPPSKKEVAALVERAMREYDETDPTLELYQNE